MVLIHAGWPIHFSGLIRHTPFKLLHAENNEGVGSFSDPVTKSIPVTLTSQGLTL